MDSDFRRGNNPYVQGSNSKKGTDYETTCGITPMYREATNVKMLLMKFGKRITPMYREATQISLLGRATRVQNNPYVQGSN